MRSQAWSPSSPFGMTNQAAPMYHTYRPQKHNMAGLTAVIQWIRQTGCAVLGTYLSTLRYEKCVSLSSCVTLLSYFCIFVTKYWLCVLSMRYLSLKRIHPQCYYSQYHASRPKPFGALYPAQVNNHRLDEVTSDVRVNLILHPKLPAAR